MATAPTAAVLTATRLALHQVAVHVLARRRHTLTGRIGLRPAPGGLATPAFGDGGEVVRVCGGVLVVEHDGALVSTPLTTLAAAADLVGVDLAADLSVGRDTPPLADPSAPLALDAGAVRALGDWWGLGATVLDEVAALPLVSAASAPQIWPEHFDHAAVVEAGGARFNVGASPGDGGEPGPYLYVGPWGDDRPGDPAYWNAPFGAVLRRADLEGAGPDERRDRALAFVRQGLSAARG
ncbi:MAG TPA: hypothetical protein VFI47_27720 [Acidimicrobiales bacterium]|nr:hypothetical protein [Acidimicrobiales bacterium]